MTFPLPFIFRRVLCVAALVVAVGFIAQANAAEGEGKLIPELEPFRRYLGKTWRGELKDSTAAKPVIDVSRWERALNGTAIRTVHSINNGAYGGESIIRWDAAKKTLVYHYFTTAGFMTTGTMKFEGAKMVSVEAVTGSANGVTEVRATNEIRADGTMVTNSEYLRNGKWEPGHGAAYREDPKAEVVFK